MRVRFDDVRIVDGPGVAAMSAFVTCAGVSAPVGFEDHKALLERARA